MQIQCPQCFASFSLPDQLAGRKVQCNQCETKFRMPATADVTTDAAAEEASKIATRCPRCLADYKLKSKFAGKTVRCRDCKSPFIVPGVDPDKPPVVPAYQSNQTDESSYVEEDEYVPEPEPVVRKARKKPKQESLFDEYELAELEQAKPMPVSRPRQSRAAVSHIGSPSARSRSSSRTSSFSSSSSYDSRSSSRSYRSSNSSGELSRVAGIIVAILITLCSFSFKLLKNKSVRRASVSALRREARDHNAKNNPAPNAGPFIPQNGQ